MDVHITSQGNPLSNIRRNDGRSWGCSTTPIQIYAIAGTTSFVYVAIAWKATIRIQSGCRPSGDGIPTILYPRPCDQNNRDEKQRRAVGNVETSLTTFLAILNTGIDKVLRIAEIHAVFNSHVFCVRIANGGESACCDIVPNL